MPVPFKLGWEKLPGVFKKSGATNERAMEALKNAGIIKLTGYSNAQSSCREYAVSQRFLRKLFGNDREAYLSRKDRYHYLSDIFTKRKSYSFDEMIESQSTVGKTLNISSLNAISLTLPSGSW